MDVNAQYNVAAAGSVAMKIAARQRRKMFEAFLLMGLNEDDTILDVGVTSDTSYDHSNYLEAWYPYKARITACGIDDQAALLADIYPGLRFVKGDGRSLPFADKSFDYVHSSAVLEHVGNASQQQKFVAEAGRVARKGVFMTTPNRWYPIEFHTVLPFVHWLPVAVFRRILTKIGHEVLASEENLNLLSRQQLYDFAKQLEFPNTFHVNGMRLMGLISNLLLIVRKNC